MENRPCEICGKNDVVTKAYSSSIGAVSFNYCEICFIIGAEPKGLEEAIGENYRTYNKEDDKYYLGDIPIPIKTHSGKEYHTRSDFVIHLQNELNK